MLDFSAVWLVEYLMRVGSSRPNNWTLSRLMMFRISVDRYRQHHLVRGKLYSKGWSQSRGESELRQTVVTRGKGWAMTANFAVVV